MESTLGITGPALDLVRSYLSDRTLRVQIDDSLSASQEIPWSVPQIAARTKGFMHEKIVQ